MGVTVRKYATDDIAEMIRIWNEVVEDGEAFPQTEPLTESTGADFFAAQTFCGVAEDEDSGELLGMYILHPNNTGRCGHLCNSSYAVSSSVRGRGIGRLLVEHSLRQAKREGFGVMQFNAVVESNVSARKLYERLGFIELGTIPKGFLMKDGHYEDIVLYYHQL